ncbi:MAG: hypothetical protein CSB55_02370 [Candidatus Cloacimonadota bacterium]|nr:MAG: hypothetical protein CSB55_02370 [Candidatus Cloacimonadota bacterium]
MKLRQSTKSGIALLVLFLSFLTGLKFSGLYDNITGKNTHKKIKIKSTEDIFENASNYTKYIFSFSEKNLNKLDKPVNGFLAENENNLILYEKNPDYRLLVFEIPKNSEHESLSKFPEIAKLEEKEIIASDPPNKSIDIKQHIKDKKLIKKTVERALTERNLSGREIASFKKELFTIQSRIDSLNSLVFMQKRNNEQVLVKAVIIKHSDKENTFAHDGLYFLIYFFAALTAFSLFIIIISYIVMFITKLMTFAGIETQKSAADYKKYGYESRKKKIKRIYKDLEEEDK